MNKTTVVNIRRNEYDVYIGRAGHGHDGYFGNPFSAMRDGGRERAIALYEIYFYKRLQTDSEFATRVDELRGKRLGCFCSPKNCHGNVIASYLNIDPKVRPYVYQLIQNGFHTFTSCDGGKDHGFDEMTIRISIHDPDEDFLYDCPLSKCGEKKCFDKCEELRSFVESQGWTHCRAKIVKSHHIDGTKREQWVYLELIWSAL